MGAVKTVNFLRMYDRAGNQVRDLTIKPGENAIRTADFMFERNQGIGLIAFITADFEEGVKPSDSDYTVLATVSRDELQELQESGFTFEDRVQEETSAIAEEAVELENNVVNTGLKEEQNVTLILDLEQVRAKFLLQVVGHLSFKDLTIQEANILAGMLERSVNETVGETLAE